MYLTENRLGKNEIWCAADNHNCMCHVCAKELSKNINFSRNGPQMSCSIYYSQILQYIFKSAIGN